MIPKACKRLAEVDFPIAVVSKHAAREKSIRHGHPSTLHLWWARRPLAACRSMLCALLWPDPCDPACPPAFREQAQAILGRWTRKLQGLDVQELPPEAPPRSERKPVGSEVLREELLRFIGEFANWDYAASEQHLTVARELVKAAHGDEPPLVVDPFAGGGSIPLEALRLGCDAFASDLNPVACLILKVMLEDIPRHGPGLADKLREAGAQIKAQAEKELAEFYPPDPDGARPIAYLWARTVRCEAPNCGAEIPLMRSFWLCKKANRKRALHYEVMHEKGQPPRVAFDIFEPKRDSEVSGGTVNRAKATCLCCHTVLPAERTRAQLAAQRGGADVIFDGHGKRSGGALMTAVVCLRENERGRHYRLPAEEDYAMVRKAQRRLDEIADQPLPNGLSPIPDEMLPPVGTLGFRVQRYGMLQWGDLFTARQKVAIAKLSSLSTVHCQNGLLGISLALGKLLDLSNALCGWIPQVECPSAVFKLGRVKPSWDYVESAPLRESSGSYSVCVDNLVAGVRSACHNASMGQVELAPAQYSPLPDESVSVWFTDPPYYDAIPYSDLSDFFFVWMKRLLDDHSLMSDPYDKSNPLTPKALEAVQDETRCTNDVPRTRAFFEEAMATSFAEGRRVLSNTGIGCVVFAHKTTEGWEALLSGTVSGGWTITGSWPIATEMGHRLRARDSAALATSVHLVCRPRPDDAPVGDWSEVLRELPVRVGDWMERLQAEGLRGADLVFACIGPALEIYSRYQRVEDAEGNVIPLGGDPEAKAPHERGYLAYVWETVGRIALQQILGTAEARARNGAAGALEEDARLTALFLWTLESTKGDVVTALAQGEDPDANDDTPEDEEEEAPKKKSKGFSLVFDVVRRFAQPLGIHLDAWDGRIIDIDKGVVRLLAVRERARQLFGEAGAGVAADRLEQARDATAQLELFPREEQPPPVHGRVRRRAATAADAELQTRTEATTLDRIHAAMLLQAGGRAHALRALLKSEQERGPDFLRLSNALSALYPNGSEEKRLLDAMLLAMPH